MPKYLITGGCGFIGSHVAESLLASAADVKILDDLSTGKKDNAPAEAELLIGSITDKTLVSQALADVDGVVHLAAIPSVQQSIDNWAAVHAVNCGGTVTLFDAISTLKRKIPVIFASSSSVYGEVKQLPISEDASTIPLSPYGLDKLTGEKQAHLLTQLFDVPTCVLRLFNIYGPRQDPSSPYSGVLSLFTKWIANNSPLTIYGDGEQKRDFVYVKDVARVIKEILHQPLTGAHIYNMCTGEGTTINQLADVLSQVACLPIQKRYAPSREGEIRVSVGDPTKLQTALHLKASTPLEEGMKELLNVCV